MDKFILEVSETVKNEQGKNVRQKLGDVAAFYPLLSELGIAVEPTKRDEDGFPIYETEVLNFVFDSVLAATKVIVKNRLNGITLKAGQTIPTTVTELLTSSDNRGEGLRIAREFLAAFIAFLPSTGLSEKAQGIAASLCKNKEALSLQDESRKKKFKDIFANFVSTMNASDLTKYDRNIIAIEDALESAPDF